MDLPEYSSRYFFFMFGKPYILKEFIQVIYRHDHELLYRPFIDFNIRSFFFQPGTLAGRTGSLSPVTGKHDTVLNLIFLLFEIPKKCIQSPKEPVAGP